MLQPRVNCKKLMMIALTVCVAMRISSPAQTMSGTAKETILHSFGGPDGAGALSGVIAGPNGSFFGTTVFGGPTQVGTVFELTPHGSGYQEKVLHSFSGPDGSKPSGGLIAGPDESLYGFTTVGGDSGCGFGCGTVFKLTKSNGVWKESTIYFFHGGSDASQPTGAPVLGKNGALYGVTQFGGTSGQGAVFKLTPVGSSYKESVLYSFPTGAGGYLPQAGLTIDSRGALYGTTYYGGDTAACDGAGCGLVFKLTPKKSGYAESVLYRFTSNGDGAQPIAAPTVDNQTGIVYGTTEYGGSHQNGIVFQLTPSSNGYTEKILYSFTGKADGFDSMSQLLLSPDGTLYGTSALGGGGCNGIGCGVIYRLNPTQSGYSFQVVYDFRSPSHGAETDWTILIMDAKGALYGTTRSGGSATQCNDGGPGGAPGCGTVFKLVP